MPPSLPVMENQANAAPSACPLCRQVDSVQAVSGVYRAGYIQLPKPPAFGPARRRTLEVRHIPGVSPLNILSAELAPPVEPAFSGAFFSSQASASPGWPLDLPAFVFLALRYALTAAAAAGLAWFVFRSAPAAWALLVVLLAWLFIRRFSTERRQAQTTRQAHAAWQQQMEGWQNLLYCARDQVVFLPGSLKTAAPASWRAALES